MLAKHRERERERGRERDVTLIFSFPNCLLFILLQTNPTKQGHKNREKYDKKLEKKKPLKDVYFGVWVLPTNCLQFPLSV